jgi:opacity protein-like surface antigen
MTRTCGWIVGVLCLLAVGAGEARAQGQGRIFYGLATASLGSTFGGDVSGGALTPGASVSVHDENGWGTEMDFAFANDSGAPGAEADLTTLAVNVMYMHLKGPIRPYVLIGAGAVGIHGCLTACPQVTTTWDLGLGLGGGVLYRFTDLVGFRGDARYTWLPGDGAGRPANFGFWRASAGVTFQWALLP